MNMLAITSSYPRYDGDPTAPFIESLTRHIALRGHSIHLVLPANREWRRRSEDDNVHYHPYRYSPLRSWTPWGYSESLEAGVRIRRPLYALAPLVYLTAARTGNAVAKRTRCDVVHAHWVIPNGPIASLVARQQRLPLVISLHGSDISVAERSRWMHPLVRSSFTRAAAVTAPSEDLLERARRLGATGDLVLVPYGADPNALQVDSAERARVRTEMGIGVAEIVVVGIGRFVHWKGFDDLIDAAGRARQRGSNMRLVLVGDGDLRDELQARALALGLGEAVTFVGMAPRAKVPAYLAAADVVAVPSVHHAGYVDGLPNVALEAMAAGKPLIATRVGGLPQVVRDGENGFLVEERDPAALAEAILRLSSDPQLRRTMGAAGRERILESLTWERVAERFCDVLERARRIPGS